MECNKEEATRAKEIAERKMKSNDFIGAQKIAIKALQMFPHLENISQMMAVCEVHIAAGTKRNGLMDLYGILQVEPTADDSSVKKQYKKLALLLHPDKNQFPGAEAAFKLIGEAQIILGDRTKRQLYDMKYKVQMKADTPKQPPQQAGNNSHVQRNVNKENSKGLHQQQQQQPNVSNNNQTFWTKCPYCSMRYEYFRTFLYKAFYCPNCSKAFIAYDVIANPQPSEPQTSKPATAAGGCTGNVGVAAKVNNANFVNFASQEKSRKSSRNDDDGSDFANPHKKFKGESFGRHNNESKLRQAEGRYIDYPDGEFFDFKKIRDVNKFAVNQIWAVYCDVDGMPRFYALITKIEATKCKVYFSWLEDFSSNKIQMAWPYENLPMAFGNFVVGESGCAEDWMIFSHVASWQKGKGVNTYHIYPRKGEVWALFKGWKLKQTTSKADSSNLYEFDVVQVLSEFAETGFTVIRLVKIDGFVSLFKHAEEDPYVIPPNEMLGFSHYIPYYRLNGTEREGIPEGFLELDCASLPSDFKEKFPSVSLHTRGEEHSSRLRVNDSNGNQNLPFSETSTGDMEKGREANQYSKSQENGQHEARQAQVLVSNKEKMNPGDTSQENATENGSSSPVVRNQTSNADIHEGIEVNQYSKSQVNGQHEATQTQEVVSDKDKNNTGDTGQEYATGSGSSSPVVGDQVTDADLQKGEVDQYSKSQENGHHEATQAQELESHEDEMNTGDTSQENATENASSSSAVRNQVADAYLQTKFYDFEVRKNIANFKNGQIWAISNMDEYPRNYGFVLKVETEQSQVQIAHLVACPNKEEEQWFNAGMPFSCGTFVVDQEKTVTLNNHVFSQLMLAEQVGTCNQYAILPSAGEIWALYRNWRLGWNHSDLKTCGYYVVEICERTPFSIKARPLQKVDGFESVFKHESEGRFVINMEIPAEQYIRFSHRIPAVPLTNESSGRLQGCGYWELDAVSVPNF